MPATAIPDSPALSATAPRFRLATPREDRTWVAQPVLADWSAALESNRRLFGQTGCERVSPPLFAPCPQERRVAREMVWKLAQQWTAKLLEAAQGSGQEPGQGFGQGSGQAGAPLPLPATRLTGLASTGLASTGLASTGAPQLAPLPATAAWIVTGHQPGLFHPGVWVKNFAVSALARRQHGVSLNLVVDNDIASPPALVLPTQRGEAARVQTVAWDSQTWGCPWEEARVHDRRLFESCGSRAQTALEKLGLPSDIGEFWQGVVRAEQALGNPAWAFAAGRVAWERRLGCENLELPLSALCESEVFRRFVGSLLADLPRLHAIYNRVVAEYREQHGIRGKNHPVPDLRQEGDWLEAPFWIWREGEQTRSRLLVKDSGTSVALSDGRETLAQLEKQGRVADAAVAVLADLARRGYRVRTRALTTTLFARLYLADLFVHGLGGARYDEMADQIIERFWGIPAPAFATLSATLHLPLGGFPQAAAEEARLRARLRDSTQHPERYLPQPASAVLRELAAEKQRLIEQQHAARAGRPTSLPGPIRHRRLLEVTRLLAEGVAGYRRQLQTQLEVVVRQVAAEGVLHNRERAGCLFPLATLREFFEHVSHQVG